MSCQSLIAKHPNYIPVIILPNKDINICKRRFLFPRDNNFGFCLCAVRKHISEIKANEALFFIIDDKLVTMTEFVGSFYDRYKIGKKPDDAYLYVKIYKENTFGIKQDKIYRNVPWIRALAPPGSLD